MLKKCFPRSFGLCVVLAAITCSYPLTIASAVAEDLPTATLMRLKEDIQYLASDGLEGRDVGSPGIELAGEFIAKRFDELGLKTDSFDGTPFQDFTIPGPAELGDVDKNFVSLSGPGSETVLELGENYNPLSLGSNGAFSGPVVFAGYGISAPDLGYDDYADVDVKGKVVIVIRKEPQQQQEDSIFDGQRSSQYAYFSSKELNAAVHEVAAMILVNDAITASDGDNVMGVTAGGSALSDKKIPTIYCQRSMIDPILERSIGKTLAQLEREIDEELTPQSQQLDGVTANGEVEIRQSEIPVRNVVGLLPGKGNLADEYVVVGAHYDHVGKGGRGSLAPGTVAIHNGADDNASGTCTMLEVARRMSVEQSEDRRSLLFMAFTGEERGLLGSKHYVRNPRWPLEQTVAMINMDMVGRLTDNRLTVYGTGTAEGFEELVDRWNEEGRFDLAKQAAGFGPSDHSSFYQADIPVFHFFTGLHDDYHRPSDDPDKVNFNGMTRIADMVTGVVQELATVSPRPKHVKVTGFADVGRGRRSRPARAVMGVQLDLDYEGKGAALDAVPESGPAAKAGLQPQDVIIKIDDEQITSVRDLRTALATRKPGDKITVIVSRGDSEETVEITLDKG